MYPREKVEKVEYKLKNTTCPDVKCKMFIYLDKSKTIFSSFLEKSIIAMIGCRTSCLMPNVIYMTCLKCRAQYMAKTKIMLRKRMYEHLRSKCWGYLHCYLTWPTQWKRTYWENVRSSCTLQLEISIRTWTGIHCSRLNNNLIQYLDWLYLLIKQSVVWKVSHS